MHVRKTADKELKGDCQKNESHQSRDKSDTLSTSHEVGALACDA